MASKKSRAKVKTPSPSASSKKAPKKSAPKAAAAKATAKPVSRANGIEAGRRSTGTSAKQRGARASKVSPKRTSAAKPKSNGQLGAASAPTLVRGPVRPAKAADPASAAAPKAKPRAGAKGQSPTAMAAALGVAKAVLDVAKAALTSSSETKPKSKSKGKAAAESAAEASNAVTGAGEGAARVGVGDDAPSFVLRDDSGTLVSSESLRGSPYILYFYPKDDTPGCTLQACGFRDSLPRFSARGVRVLGVSADTPESHTRFKKKYGLTFPLLSDPEKTLAKAYGVWTKKTNYGREYMGIERSTFHVDKNGKLHRVWRSVRVPGHVDAVLDSV